MKFLMLVVPLLFAQSARDPMRTEFCANPDNLISELKFLKKFVGDMQSGNKTATTRRGIRCVRAGQLLLATTPTGEKLGSLLVSKASVIAFDEINAELAAAENTSVLGLQNGLVSIYGPEIKSQDLTAVFFRWIP